MGALIRILPGHRESVVQAINRGIGEAEPNGVLGELCRQGFFVQSELDEQSLVRRILDKERENVGFNIIILPHENCNFRCTYCYEKFERGKMRQDVVSGLKNFVAANTQKWRYLSIGWFGGEPLLAKDVICDLSDSFQESCNRHGARLSGSITTNAYFLDAQVARKLLDRGVEFFQ